MCVCVCVCVCVKWGTWWTEGFQEYGIEKVGLWGRKLEETGEDCMMEFHDFYPNQILL